MLHSSGWYIFSLLWYCCILLSHIILTYMLFVYFPNPLMKRKFVIQMWGEHSILKNHLNCLENYDGWKQLSLAIQWWKCASIRGVSRLNPFCTQWFLPRIFCNIYLKILKDWIVDCFIQRQLIVNSILNRMNLLLIDELTLKFSSTH